MNGNMGIVCSSNVDIHQVNSNVNAFWAAPTNGAIQKSIAIH